MNSRLDTLHAAILLPKFEVFRKYELDNVNQAADWYKEELKDYEFYLPVVKENFKSSWAQYTIRLPERVNRPFVQMKLKEENIPTMIYYTKPMHRQSVFCGTYSSKAECPVTEELCDTVLSLPIGPYITRKEVENVTGFLKKLIDIK